MNDWIPCEYCKGTGFAKEKDTVIVCPLCNGFCVLRPESHVGKAEKIFWAFRSCIIPDYVLDKEKFFNTYDILKDKAIKEKDAVTIQLLHAISFNIKARCGFRGLIYNLMHFNHNAYAPLYCSGGMDLVNCMADWEERKKSNDI